MPIYLRLGDCSDWDDDIGQPVVETDEATASRRSMATTS